MKKEITMEDFLLVIGKAKTACTNTKQEILDHFVDFSKMVDE